MSERISRQTVCATLRFVVWLLPAVLMCSCAEAREDLPPAEKKALLAAGVQAAKTGDPATAVRDLSRVIEADTTIADAYSYRAGAHFSLGAVEAALADYDRAIALSPENTALYFNRGVVRLNAALYEKATQDFNKVLEKTPKDVDALLYRAAAHGGDGRPVNAINDYNAALKLRPGSAEIYLRRGNVFFDVGNLEGSIKDYTRAIETDSAYADAWYNRANAYYNLGQTEAAIADFSRAIACTDNNLDSYYSRANTYLAMKEYRKALDDYRYLTGTDFANPKLYFNKALVHYKLQEYAPAVQDLSTYLQRDPGAKHAYFNRGEAYFHLGDKDKAYQDYLRCLDSDSIDVRQKIKVRQAIRDMGYEVPEETLGTFVHTKGDIAFKLPESWYTKSIDNGNTTVMMVAENNIEPDTAAVEVGVTISLVRQATDYYPTETREELVSFGMGLVNQGLDNPFKNDVIKNEEISVNAYSGLKRTIQFQYKRGDDIVRMIQLVLSDGKNLAIATYECPEKFYGHYKDIFEKSLMSLTLK